jgi:hypothetical protein
MDHVPGKPYRLIFSLTIETDSGTFSVPLTRDGQAAPETRRDRTNGQHGIGAPRARDVTLSWSVASYTRELRTLKSIISEH